MASRIDEGISNLILLSVPLFVFLGLLIEMAGLARVLVDFLAALLGHVRGGLSYVLLGAMYLVSGISGSKAADMAAVAPVLFPEMRRAVRSPGELVALLAASGAMSETIPPSLVLITIGSVTGVSIAGAVYRRPAAGAVAGARRWSCCRWLRSRGDDVSGVERAPARAVVAQLRRRVAGAGAAVPDPRRRVRGHRHRDRGLDHRHRLHALAGLLIYRQFDWRRLYPMLVDTASLSGAILLIIGTATAMAWALTQSGFSQTAGRAMAQLPGGAAGFMAVRSSPSSCSAACWRAFRRSCCSARCCFPRRAARRPRSALRHGGDPRDGDRPVRAAVRRRVLCRLRDRPGGAR